MNSGELFQTFVSGLSLGSTYALVSLGFVIVWSATRVLNFAQGAFVLLGGYLTYQVGSAWGLGYVGGLVLAALICSVLAAFLEWALIRRFERADEFQASIVTAGLLFIAQAAAIAIWGNNPLNVGDPWGLDTVNVFGAVISVADIWTVGILVIAMALIFSYLQFTRGGLAMRACVSDREAAVAQGISPSRVSAVAWAMAGAAGAVTGGLLATGSGGVNGELILPAFAALPAMVLGGLSSPPGAIVGGLIVGVVQQFTFLLQPVFLPQLGIGFAAITPFVILVIVLAVRPQGLFGSRLVERF